MIGYVAGHGGRDRGTRAGGIDEASYALAFAHDLAAYHRRLWPELPAALLRRVDEDLSLVEAAERAHEARCSLVVVEHVNAHATAPLRGASCYYWPGDTVGRVVGDAILAACPPEVRPLRAESWAATDWPGPDDDWLQRPRAVLGPYHRRGISACLVESFYASFPFDRAAAHSRWVRERMLLARLAGVAAWRQLVAPESVGPYEPPPVCL